MTLCVVQVLLSPAKYCAGVVFAVPAGDRDDVRGGDGAHGLVLVGCI